MRGEETRGEESYACDKILSSETQKHQETLSIPEKEPVPRDKILKTQTLEWGGLKPGAPPAECYWWDIKEKYLSGLNARDFAKFIKPCQVICYTEGVLRIRAPGLLEKDWLTARICAIANKALPGITGNGGRIEFET